MTLTAGKGAGFWVAIVIVALLAALASSGAAPATADAKACEKGRAQADKISRPKARKAMRCLINRKRSNLKLKGQLVNAAQSHSSYMKRKKCFKHQCQGEAPLSTRISRTGYFKGASSYSFGEVIALNSRNASPLTVFRQLMDSPPHRAIMMNGSFKHLGVGVAIRGRWAYWTGVFARRSG